MATPDQKKRFMRPLISLDGGMSHFVFSSLQNLRRLILKKSTTFVTIYVPDRYQQQNIQRKGQIAEVILEIQAEQQCNLYFMSGCNKPPVIDVVFGSSLDQVFRESSVPVLICR